VRRVIILSGLLPLLMCAAPVAAASPGPAPVPGPDGTRAQEAAAMPGPVTAKLTLRVTASSTTYRAVGDVIDLTYALTNSGDVPLQGPYSVTNDALDVTCPARSRSLAPDTSTTCSASRTIGQADLDAGLLVDTATGHARFGRAPVDSNTASVTLSGVQAPKLTLMMRADTATYVSVGDVIHYTYGLTNSGNVTLAKPYGVVAFVVLPHTVATPVDCPPSPASLAPGDSVICTGSHTVTQADLDAGSVTSTAQGYATYGGATVTTARKTITVEASQGPSLTLLKSADVATFTAVGDAITYTFVLTNTGNVTLDGPFSVDDPLIADHGDPNRVECEDASSLPPGQSIACSARYLVTQADLDAGQVTNIATAHAASGDTAVDASDSETVRAVVPPALSLDKSADARYIDHAGQVIAYKFRLTNDGSVTLSGPFSVTDDLTGATPCAGQASLAPGQSLTCSASYTVKQSDVDAGSVTNTAVGHASFGGAPVDSPLATVTVGATRTPALRLVKSADVTSYAEVGEPITYTYTLTNTGNVTLSAGYSVDDDWFTSHGMPGSVGCPPKPASLPPGASIACTATYRVTQEDLDAGSITNTAVGHAAWDSRTIDSNLDTVTVGASQGRALGLAETSPGAWRPVDAGPSANPSSPSSSLRRS
jgi:uncharacterized repeat protein (TIGR01451 family)